MILISCVFKTTVHRYNITSYKKVQLKLHRSLLGVKGGGIPAIFPTLGCNGKNQYFRPNLVISATFSTNNLILHTTYNKYIVNFFLKLLGWGPKIIP